MGAANGGFGVEAGRERRLISRSGCWKEKAIYSRLFAGNRYFPRIYFIKKKLVSLPFKEGKGQTNSWEIYRDLIWLTL